MFGLLNLGSLVLGLIAWILPAVSLLHNNKNWVAYSVLSLVACTISLAFQIYYHAHLVSIEDWSALMDTTGAVALVATILLVVTIILNTITWLIYRKRVSQ